MDTTIDSITSEEIRGKKRLKRVALNSLAAMANKVSNMLVLLISVPVTVKYLGAERFGLWLTIGSLLTFLNFADLGMGYGIQNSVSEADGKEDMKTAREYISSGLFMLLCVVLSFAILFLLFDQFVSWARFFNVNTRQAIEEARPTARAFAVCFAISMPIAIVNRVQLGFQQGFLNNLWLCFGNILGLAGLLLCVHLQAGLPWLVLSVTGAPIVATLLNAAVYFGVMNVSMRPRWALVKFDRCRSLFRIGLKFLYLQVMFALGYCLDNLIIARTLGTADVATYSVCVRMFAVIPMLVSTVYGSLWPAYSEAYARGDMEWLRKTLSASIRTGLISTAVAAFLLALFAQPLIALWLKGRLSIPTSLIWGMAVWTVLDSLRHSLMNFLNGINRLRFQAYVLTVYVFSSILFKFLLAKQYGLHGILWSGIVTYFFFFFIPALVYARRIIHDLHIKMYQQVA